MVDEIPIGNPIHRDDRIRQKLSLLRERSYNLSRAIPTTRPSPASSRGSRGG